MVEKVFEWEIKIADYYRGEFEYMGKFVGTSRALNDLKKAIDVYVDTEEGFNTSYKFTKLKEVVA